MSHSISSALSRALHQPITHHHHHRPLHTNPYEELLKKWTPRRRQTLARHVGLTHRVRGAVASLERENRPHKLPLLSLLHGLGIATQISATVPGKVDLSHSDPLATTWERKAQRRGKVLGRYWAPLSRKGIVENFISYYYYGGERPWGALPNVDRLEGDVVERVFTGEALRYLERKGCTPEDVMAWVWILMARDGVAASLRLDAWAKAEVVRMEEEARQHGERVKAEKLAEEWKQRVGEWKRREESEWWPWNRALGLFKRQTSEVDGTIISTHPPPEPTLDTTPHPIIHRIPPFLLLFILRFPHLPPTTLRLLLPYITATLQPALFPSGDTKTPLLLLLRLLRHSRATYPSAIPYIATLLTTHLHPTTSPPLPNARLTATYNRLLTLFSTPSHNRPFKLLPLHQSSQFLLLRKMASLNLPITREGYRALITIQLAHSKTPFEAHHVQNMASSWPPWQVQRDGHPLRPPPHLSRSALVLEQMTSAGYALWGWETEALVLGGVDTDGSPTVQTRTWYSRRRGGVVEAPRGVWGARVRATRTVEEAWSVFAVALEERVGEDVWVEMFAKLVAERKGRKGRERWGRALEGVRELYSRVGEGAGKLLRLWEVRVKREAERERRVVPGEGKEVAVAPPGGVYVGSPVPSVEELFGLMKRFGNVEMSERLVIMLVKDANTIEAADWILKEWSKERWRRMVEGLAPPESLTSSHPNFQPLRKRHYYTSPPLLTSYLHLLFAHTHNRHLPPVDHTIFAIRLLLGHAPPRPPAWNTTILGLTVSLSSPRLTHGTKKWRAHMVWRLYTDMTRLMEPDVETLRILCVAAERALRLSETIKWDGCEPVEKIITIFHKAFEMKSPETPEDGPEPLPRLLIPEPATLHAYVRLLGFTGRHERILELLVWMRGVELDMEGVMARRVVVAARVFLEDDKVVAGRAREVVEGWLGWEGWPGEEEVEEYCVIGGLGGWGSGFG